MPFTLPEHDAEKRRTALAAAGIPADRQERLLAELARIFEVHAAIETSAPQDAEALQGVVTAAVNATRTRRWSQKLAERTQALPLGLRFSLFEYQGYRRGQYLGASAPLKEFTAWAKIVRALTRRSRGRPATNLSGVLFELSLLLGPEFPDGGISKSGGRAFWNGSDRTYGGPLLDLVEALLGVENVPAGSSHAVGRTLWEFKSAARRAE